MGEEQVNKKLGGLNLESPQKGGLILDINLGSPTKNQHSPKRSPKRVAAGSPSRSSSNLPSLDRKLAELQWRKVQNEGQMKEVIRASRSQRDADGPRSPSKKQPKSPARIQKLDMTELKSPPKQSRMAGFAVLPPTGASTSEP